jgi:hypothetical protein
MTFMGWPQVAQTPMSPTRVLPEDSAEGSEDSGF